MQLNNWNDEYIDLAERVWGKKRPKYTLDIFNFALNSGNSWLDLGCGFGRFLKFLLENRDEPDYIGYDSSKSMIERIHKNFPEYFPHTFHRDITDKIIHHKEVIVSNAVLIHLNQEDQTKVLKRMLESTEAKRNFSNFPKALVFDINSYSNSPPCGYFREVVSERNFRMSYQDPNAMYGYLKSNFKKYSIKVKKYKMRKEVVKTTFFLKTVQNLDKL